MTSSQQEEHNRAEDRRFGLHYGTAFPELHKRKIQATSNKKKRAKDNANNNR